MKNIVIGAALALVLAGCGEVEEDVDFWTLAPVGDGYVMKQHIDDAAAEGDCAELQTVFDMWADADHVIDFTPAILDYVDGALEGAGCYG